VTPLYPQRTSRRGLVQGNLANKKHPTPWDHHRTLGIGLLMGIRRGVFPMSETPLYRSSVNTPVSLSRQSEPLMQSYLDNQSPSCKAISTIRAPHAKSGRSRHPGAFPRELLDVSQQERPHRSYGGVEKDRGPR
jgi:hypothetical protein